MGFEEPERSGVRDTAVPGAAMVKLGRPRAGGAVPRERLFTLLDRARERPIVWLSGPAGAGKTTLATTWIEARRLACLWYHVGEEDGDVASFFYHLGLAARPLCGAGAPLPLLTVESRAGLSGFSRRFFQELFTRLPPGAVLVFDNVEQAPPESGAWHAALADGLELIPPGTNVLFLSRGAPLPALSRHRARREVELVGFEELRLTAPESEEVARAILGREALGDEAARRVFHMADGWAAGLVLLLEWMRHEGDVFAEIRPSDAPALFDYFATEVLARVDPQTQRFLLETAVLPSATPEMAARLTGLSGTERLLSVLHQQNFFTERHPGREPSYRYHPAFRRFLLERLAATWPADRVADLEDRAAAVLADAGRPEEALALLCRAGRLASAAPLLRSVAPALVAQGRTETLLGWLGHLPPAALDDEPWLRHWRGVCRLVARHAGATEDLERALDGFVARGDADGAYTSWAELVEAISMLFVDLGALDDLLARHDGLRATFPAIPGPALESRVATSRYMAMAARRPSDPSLPGLRDHALELARRHAGTTALLRVGAFALIQDATRGDENHGQALARALEALDLSAVPALVRLSWCFARATLAVMSGAVTEAMDHVTEGLERASASGLTLLTAELAAVGVLAAALREDAATGRRLLGDMDAWTSSGDLPPYRGRDFLVTYLLLTEGDLDGALAQARRSENELDRLGYGPGPAYAATLDALVLALRDCGEETAAAIQRALERGRAIGMPRFEYALLVLEADRRARAGAPDAAAVLAQAFAIGARHGFARSRLFLPRVVLTRIHALARATGVDPIYTERIARAHGLEEPPAAAATPRIEVRTLGRFAVLRDGAPLPASRKLPRRPLALLKALIAFGEREVPEAVLGTALWPDADGDAAHEALAINLRRLRQLLGDKDAVLRAGNQLSLDPDRVWTDARALRELFQRIDELLAVPSQAGDQALEELTRRLLALYGGDFLPDEDVAWVIAPRERQHAQLVRRAAALASHWEARGAWERAVACYEAALEVAELSEPLYLGLVRCYRALDRSADAFATVERCRRTLAAAGLRLPSELAAAARATSAK